MSRRSNGRRWPSRGARIERRKAERAIPAAGRTVMRIPDAIRALTVTARKEGADRG